MDISNSKVVVRKNEFDVVWSNLMNAASFISRHKIIVIKGGCVGGLLGLLLTFVVPAEWESGSLIRVGQLGNVDSVGTPIEPPIVTVDRIKSRPFQNDVLLNLGLSTSEEDKKVNDFRKNLKIKLEKSELINVTVKGESQDEAKRYMNAVISQLKKVHSAMTAPAVNRWHQEVHSIESDFELTRSKSERLIGLLDKREVVQDSKNFLQAVVLNNNLVSREKELQNLGERKRQLEERLSPEKTFETSSLGGIEVSEKPVFPNKSLFTITGILIGLILGIGLAKRNSAMASN